MERRTARTGALAGAVLVAGALAVGALARRGAPAPARADTSFFRQMPAPPRAPKHVHLMHLDGFRPDLFEALLEDGRLPNIAFLAARGRISYEASTVDKSETMKVIESYLTSRRDTFVVGWWQWDRSTFKYRNFWLDPAEVVDYAVGPEFPRYPTLFDFLSAHGQEVASGFGLHRRSVPFTNYSRAYLEGAEAVSQRTYYDQAHATMTGARRVYERIAREGGRIPALSTSLLAPADEFGHLEGVVRSPADRVDASGEACFDRGADPRLEAIFARIEEDARAGGVRGVAAHFTRVDSAPGTGPYRLCVHLPRLTVHADPVPEGSSPRGASREDFAAPRYVLGMIAVDIEVGNLIDTLRSIRFDASGAPTFDAARGNGIAAYTRAGVSEGSLFESTLFVLMGDHGMVDTRHMMAPIDREHPDPDRDPGSQDATFIETLDHDLGLVTGAKTAEAPPDQLLGIDDTEEPQQIARPNRSTAWQSDEIRALTGEADRWASDFVAEVKDAIKDEAHRKYWWLRLLQSKLIDPRIDGAFAPHESEITDMLAALYLKGEPRYVDAEREALRAVYARQVRLVYGGGARNNAELFLPAVRDGQATWDVRPTADEILAYRPGGPESPRLMDVLRRIPAVGLIFVRRQNGDIVPSYAQRDGRMEILCEDRLGERGEISVERDPATSEIVYGYRVPDDSLGDPLGYDDLPRGRWTYGTYAEWNDRSVEARHYFHNAVAGMGSFLYSNNPAIGDITLLHAQGWNFGDNAGGHGGLQREEKLTVMLLSGPGITPGPLRARAQYRAKPDGTGVVEQPWLAYPTVVDAAPTILDWLGYGEGALSAFARDGGFERQLRAWDAEQRADILDHLDQLDGLDALSKAAGIDLRPSRFRDRIARLLRFMPTEAPALPDYRAFREDGLRLDY